MIVLRRSSRSKSLRGTFSASPLIGLPARKSPFRPSHFPTTRDLAKAVQKSLGSRGPVIGSAREAIHENRVLFRPLHRTIIPIIPVILHLAERGAVP